MMSACSYLFKVHFGRSLVSFDRGRQQSTHSPCWLRQPMINPGLLWFIMWPWTLTYDFDIAGASGWTSGPAPTEKLPLLGGCMGRHILPVLHMHTLLERSYSTRTTMKRTNISQRTNKKLQRQLPCLPQWIRNYPLNKPIFSISSNLQPEFAKYKKICQICHLLLTPNAHHSAHP